MSSGYISPCGIDYESINDAEENRIVQPPSIRFNRINSPKIVLGIVATVYLLFIVVRLANHDFDSSYFVTAGDRFCNSDLVPNDLSVLKNSDGYDGQFYYRIALHPFSFQKIYFGITLDVPAYRHQRIIYPMVVWAFSMGQTFLIPIVMIIVNYIALCLMAWVGASLLQSMNKHALWALAIPFYPGFLLTLARDLTEIVAVLFMLMSLLCIRKAKPIYATLFLTLAVFTKETTLLVAGAAGLVWFVGFWRFSFNQTIKWYTFSVPILIYAIWQMVLLHFWGELALQSGSPNLGIPFSGLIHFFQNLQPFQTTSQLIGLIELCFIGMFSSCVFYALRSKDIMMHEKVIWICYLLFASLFTKHIWVEDWAFLRALSEFYVLGLLIIISRQYKLKYVFVFGSLNLWLILFMRTIH